MYKVTVADAVHGPVDVKTLQKWARQRRILPDTVLTDLETGQPFAAHRLADLQPIFSKGAKPPRVAPTPTNGPPFPRKPRRLRFLAWVYATAIVLIGTVWAVSYLGHRQAQAHAARLSEDNLDELNNALLLYTRKHNGSFPPMHSAAVVKKALLPYIRGKNASVFVSPVTKQPYQPNPLLGNKNLHHLDIKALSTMATFYERRVTPIEKPVRAGLPGSSGQTAPPPERREPARGDDAPVAPSETALAERWVRVTKVTGKQPSATKWFTITGRRWRVRWDTRQDAAEDAFQIAVDRPRARKPFAVAVDVKGTSKDRWNTTTQGKFRVRIDTRQSFTVVVEELFDEPLWKTADR